MDLDGGDIGSAVRAAVQVNIDTNTKAKLGWSIQNASRFTSVADVGNQIVDERAWAALVGKGFSFFLAPQFVHHILYLQCLQARRQNSFLLAKMAMQATTPPPR